MATAPIVVPPSLPTDSAVRLWRDALMAARLFAVDPCGLRGVTVRAGPGPLRDRWLDTLRWCLPKEAPIRRLPAGTEDDRLIGAIDLTATLATGGAVLQKGVLAEADGGIVLIPLAERLNLGVAARIAGVLDTQELLIEREGLTRRVPARIGVVAFDEGLAPDERLPDSLAERCAFLIDLGDHRPEDDAPEQAPAALAEAATAARLLWPSVEAASSDIVEALVSTAAAFAIESVVAPLLALRVSRAAAAWAGRTRITPEDATIAAQLVLAPRAQRVPPPEEESPEEESPEEATPAEAPPADQPPEDAPPDNQQPREPSPDDGGPSDAPTEDRPDPDDAPMTPDMPPLEDILLAAVQAAIPANLLAALKTGTPQRQPPGLRHGAGSVQTSLLRGRPVGVRLGAPRPGSRLALVETLRAAAPWQSVRRAQRKDLDPRSDAPPPPPIAVRREDFRLKKFVQRRESSIIFAVDASGSAAFHRLAETKGAVELVLGEAYVARTYAALVVFRGTAAELVLPPTRSLARAKALLAGLPGGGGTPLASGIDQAVATALAERAKGRQPLLLIMTDGRANIGRNGLAARPGAMDEALDAARLVALHRINAVFVDTAPRPRGEAAALAAAMNARYVALPYVEAGAVRDVALAASRAQPAIWSAAR